MSALPTYTCETCSIEFGAPVWHCNVCAHHWPFNRTVCSNCQTRRNAPIKKEHIKTLQRKMEAEDALIERERPYLTPEKDLYEQSSQALSSVYRILDSKEIHEGALTAGERKLKFFGCDFIKGGYIFLRALSCPAQARDFVLILLAITGGNSQQKFIITDERVSKLSGLSTRSIQRKRAALKEWQQAKNWKIVEIYEKPRDRETKQYPPTEYRVPFSDFLIRFVREMRETIYPKPVSIVEPKSDDKESPQLWGDMRRERVLTAFPENISDEDAERIAVRVAVDFEDAPIPTRAERMGSYTGHAKRDRLAASEAIALKAIAEAKQELLLRKVSPLAWWSEFRRKVAALIGRDA